MKNPFFLITVFIVGCIQQPKTIHQLESEKNRNTPVVNISKVRLGLDLLFDEKIKLIRNKSIALVTNHSGLDSNGIPNFKRLMNQKDVDLKIIFSPEHGLFGEAAAGEKINYNGTLKEFPKIVSLYGNTRKPTIDQLSGIDIIIYDIQDVGARFYTYISTLGLVMEVAAEMGIEILVLDRPNIINGVEIEGPILDISNQSFVGYYPIPIRYGLTVGELATMIKGEKWINGTPELTVIKMKNWKRNYWFDEINGKWIKPSPNIPNLETAILYPGMCLLEATNINEGRGTTKPFKRFGSPWLNNQKLAIELNNLNLPGVAFKPITFIPIDIKGMANNPKYENQICNGVELIITNRNDFNSVNTGIKIISLISRFHSEKFEINESNMNRLWGKKNFQKIINSNGEFTNNELIKTFQELSKKYHFYD